MRILWNNQSERRKVFRPLVRFYFALISILVLALPQLIVADDSDSEPSHSGNLDTFQTFGKLLNESRRSIIIVGRLPFTLKESQPSLGLDALLKDLNVSAKELACDSTSCREDSGAKGCHGTSNIIAGNARLGVLLSIWAKNRSLYYLLDKESERTVSVLLGCRLSEPDQLIGEVLKVLNLTEVALAPDLHLVTSKAPTDVKLDSRSEQSVVISKDGVSEEFLRKVPHVYMNGSLVLENTKIDGSKTIFADALVNFPRTVTQARAVEFYQDGNPVGVRLFAVKPDGIFERIGLRNKDTIVSVDEAKTIRSSEFFASFKKLLQNERGVIQVLREGQLLSINVSPSTTGG